MATTDDQPIRRQAGSCPHCHDHGYIAEDGRVVCPLGEVTNRLLADGLRYLEPVQEAPAAFRRPE